MITLFIDCGVDTAGCLGSRVTTNHKNSTDVEVRLSIYVSPYWGGQKNIIVIYTDDGRTTNQWGAAGEPLVGYALIRPFQTNQAVMQQPSSITRAPINFSISRRVKGGMGRAQHLPCGFWLG